MVSSEEIAVSLNVHADPALIRGNINCLKENLTSNIHMLIEENGYESWPLDDFKDVKIIKGFRHDFKRNPYRNVFYNLIETYKAFPNKKWYCYTEGDNFILNDKIKKDLSLINEKYGLVAADFRTVYCDPNLFYKFLKKRVQVHFCILGCCYFIRNEYMKLLCENYLQKFLNFSTLIPDCYFYPNFFQYDIAEVFIATACWESNFSIFNLVAYKNDHFVGLRNYYKMRFRPEIFYDELSESNCIIHPIKDKRALIGKKDD